MSEKIEDLLSYCSRVDFGAVNLSGEEKEFCNELNIEIISLCKSMPDSTRIDALLFIMKYFKISLPDSTRIDALLFIMIYFKASFDKDLNFFKYFYVPAWSIIYWLIQSCPKEKGSSKEILIMQKQHMPWLCCYTLLMTISTTMNYRLRI